MTNVIALAPYTIAECHIAKDEDWLDLLPQFLDGPDPTDLTTLTIEIFIRPTYDHTALIKKLSTVDGTIILDEAAAGLASINVPRATVISDLPVGRWDHFCVQSETVTVNGVPRTVYRERFRGPLYVHPGRVVIP